MKTAAALLVIILLYGLAGARPAHAIGEDTSIIIAPEYPAPREEFSAELKTFSFDLDRSAVTWLVDGAPRERGVGLRRITLIAPRAGEAMRIDIATADALYSWKVDGKNVASASGFGKNSVRFRMPDSFEDTLVEVSASTFDGSVTAAGAISVPARASQVIFYEDDPQEGVQYHRALVDGMSVPSSAFGVLATPLYFNRSDKGTLSYEWFLNGASVQSALGSETAFFRIPEDRPGSSEISVRISNPRNVLQVVESFFRVVF